MSTALERAALTLGMPAPAKVEPPYLRIVREAEPPPEPPPAPTQLIDMVGNASARSQIGFLVKAALDRGETPKHILLHGPPGLGKTTFAHLVGQMINEWRAERNMAPITVHVTSASNLRTTKNLAKVLSKVQAGDVLFVDECHRMTPMTEEMLGLAMMPPYTFVIPPASQLSGAEERPVTMEPWTFIGATTVYGKITKPLRDRMALTVQLKPYGAADMSEILRRAAQRLDIEINEESRLALAQRCHGTPREAERLLERVRDYAQLEFPGEAIEPMMVELALELGELDSAGLTEAHLAVLVHICIERGGGPVGLNQLSNAMAGVLGEETRSTLLAIEQQLSSSGFIRYTGNGRVATLAGWRHLQAVCPDLKVVIPAFPSGYGT